MADNIAEIKKIFADNGVPLVRDDVWQVQSATVVKHKALERLAASLKIRWQEPKILRAERDEAVILVAGSIGEHMEWSIGEAQIVSPSGVGGNYKVSGKQASYIWAMAEKRGKDRVIIKLAGIDAFSEEESDDFEQRRGGSVDRDHAPPPREPVKPIITSGTGPVDMRTPTPEGTKYLKEVLNAVAEFKTEAGLMAFVNESAPQVQKLLTADQAGEFRRAISARRGAIRAETSEAAA